MRFLVKDRVHHGNHADDTRFYEAGELIELSEAHAAPLLALGAIVPWVPPKVELTINPLFSESGKGVKHG